MEIKRSIEEYQDIINLPHHQSDKHPRMSIHDRSAQFAPFAALTGHAAAIKETARETTPRIELAEDELALLDRKIRRLQQNIASQPEIAITYFVPDEKKSGGCYHEYTGKITGIDTYGKKILFLEGLTVPLADIIAIEIL